MSNQEPVESKIFRDQQRASAFMRKGGRCDLCGGKANSTHEILFRSSTVNNMEARRLSFQEPLLAILCLNCHEKAHTPAMSVKLLLKNGRIYGVEAVNQALVAVQDVLRGKLGIPLLDEEVING